MEARQLGHLWSLSQSHLILPCFTSSLALLTPPALQSFSGEPREPPLLHGGPRHSRVFFVSRMSRKKRRLSTRSTRCRRPRRSARCPHPTCLLSSESAVLTSLSPALHSKPVGYPRAPTPRQEVPCEHSSEHDSLSSHGAFIAVSEVRLIINTQIIFNSGN